VATIAQSSAAAEATSATTTAASLNMVQEDVEMKSSGNVQETLTTNDTFDGGQNC
jgi:hypothetical protein